MGHSIGSDDEAAHPLEEVAVPALMNDATVTLGAATPPAPAAAGAPPPSASSVAGSPDLDDPPSDDGDDAWGDFASTTGGTSDAVPGKVSSGGADAHDNVEDEDGERSPSGGSPSDRDGPVVEKTPSDSPIHHHDGGGGSGASFGDFSDVCDPAAPEEATELHRDETNGQVTESGNAAFPGSDRFGRRKLSPVATSVCSSNGKAAMKDVGSVDGNTELAVFETSANDKPALVAPDPDFAGSDEAVSMDQESVKGQEGVETKPNDPLEPQDSDQLEQQHSDEALAVVPAIGESNRLLQEHADEDLDDFDAAPPKLVPADGETGDEDFGDFDAAPPRLVPAEDEGDRLGQQHVDEGFGDLDAAQKVGLAEDESHQLGQLYADEDFGDFDAAPKLVPAEDETGFGDFDIAPPDHLAVDATAMGAPDEFGDFGAAPSATAMVSAEDDDFGEFDSAPANETEDVSSRPAVQTSYEEKEAERSQRARLVFTRLFASHLPSDDQTRTNIDIVETPEVISISTFLANRSNEKADERKVIRDDTLFDVLLACRNRKAPFPKTIIIGDGRGPLANFSLPVGRIRSLGLRTRRNGKGAKRPSAASLPEILNIRLPSADDQLVDMASPESAPRATIEVDQDVEIIVPPSNSGATTVTPDATTTESNVSRHTENPSSDLVQDFLKRIPDLSFMLSARLENPPNK